MSRAAYSYAMPAALAVAEHGPAAVFANVAAFLKTNGINPDAGARLVTKMRVADQREIFGRDFGKATLTVSIADDAGAMVARVVASVSVAFGQDFDIRADVTFPAELPTDPASFDLTDADMYATVYSPSGKPLATIHRPSRMLSGTWRAAAVDGSFEITGGFRTSLVRDLSRRLGRPVVDTFKAARKAALDAESHAADAAPAQEGKPIPVAAFSDMDKLAAEIAGFRFKVRPVYRDGRVGSVLYSSDDAGAAYRECQGWAGRDSDGWARVIGCRPGGHAAPEFVIVENENGECDRVAALVGTQQPDSAAPALPQPVTGKSESDAASGTDSGLVPSCVPANAYIGECIAALRDALQQLARYAGVELENPPEWFKASHAAKFAALAKADECPAHLDYEQGALRHRPLRRHGAVVAVISRDAMPRDGMAVWRLESAGDGRTVATFPTWRECAYEFTRRTGIRVLNLRTGELL